jgi:hypothetical protein
VGGYYVPTNRKVYIPIKQILFKVELEKYFRFDIKGNFREMKR